MICQVCRGSIVRTAIIVDRFVIASGSQRKLCTNPSLSGQLSTSTFLSPPSANAFEVVKETVNSDLGLTYYWPTDLVVHGIEWLHSDLGVPYCFSIISGAVVIRFLLWYSEIVKRRFFTVMQERITTQQEIDYEMDCAKHEYRNVKADQLFMESKYHQRRLMQDARNVFIHFAIQSFCFITMMRGLRKCNEMLPGFHVGGLPWSPDLAVADSTILLPLITSGTVFSAFLVSKLIASNPLLMQKSSQKSRRQYALMGAFAGGAGLISFSGIASSSINVYMLSTMSVSVLQNTILNLPMVKEAAKIPDPLPARQPYFLSYAQAAGDNLAASSNKVPTSFRDVFKKRFSDIQKTTNFAAKKRERLDKEKKQRDEYLARWNAAGVGPVPVTYTKNPLVDS